MTENQKHVLKALFIFT